MWFVVGVLLFIALMEVVGVVRAIATIGKPKKPNDPLSVAIAVPIVLVFTVCLVIAAFYIAQH